MERPMNRQGGGARGERRGRRASPPTPGPAPVSLVTPGPAPVSLVTPGPARVSPVAPPSPLPVFLFPSELRFYADQRSSHRRLLTLYNPYTFPLAFKVLCTAPGLFSLVEAEGSIRARSCVDLVVRHQEVRRGNVGRRERFRVEVRGGGGLAGSREVWAELRTGRGEESSQRPAPRPLPLPPPRPLAYLPAYHTGRSPSQLAVCVCAGAVCVAVLMLPLHGWPSSLVPAYAHVSLGQKLVCAYILGLLTMVFLR